MEKVRIVTARAHRLLGAMVKQIGLVYKGGQPCTVLVPEQLTLQMERELMDRLALPGFFDIQVFSPSRLSERVLENVGRDERTPLDASGRQMAVGRAIELCEEKLVFYHSSCNRRGFVQKLTSLITDMKRGGLLASGLEDYIQGLPDGLSKQKAQDLKLLYAAYEKVLGDRFSDSEDALSYVASRLKQSGLMDGQAVYVYGFDTLPEPLIALMLAIAPLCECLTIGLILDDEQASDEEIYRPVRQSIARFRTLLTQREIPSVQTALKGQPLAHAPAIRHLDENLFALPVKRFEGAQQSVFLAMPGSPYEEATLAARQIMALIQNGYDLEQIAVLHPDGNGYAFAITAAFKDGGLPFYTDQKLPATSHGLSRFLLSALGAMAKGYRSADLLSAVKTGYSPLTFEEGCELENYAISYGIDRARWTKPFVKGGDELTAKLEPLRQKLMSPIEKAREAIVKAKDSLSSIKAVYQLLMDVKAYEKLRLEEARMLENGLGVRAAQAGQVWQALCGLMDQLALLQGGARIPLKYIQSRLESGLGAISLASLPPGRHMLHVGTLGHFLSGDMRAVFLLGLSDGLLAKDTQSLLGEQERRDLQQETGAYLGITDESRELLAKLDLKRAMTLPTDKLFLSCAKTGLDGSALRPLSLIKTLQDAMFEVLPEALMQKDELPFSPTQALSELTNQLCAIKEGAKSELSEKWQGVLSELLLSQEYGERTRRVLQGMDYRPATQPLDKGQASKLFGGELMSITRLENYAGCPFRHYVQYGLKPAIVKKWEIRPADTGTFYHGAMQAFAQAAVQEKDYPHIDEQKTLELCEKAMQPLLPQLLEGPMGDGERSKAVLKQAQRILRRASLTMTKHLAAGQFEVFKTEASFGYEGGLPPIILRLSDGREITLRGRIDRVDRFDSDKGVYLRVIDYKSGNVDFNAAKTWWGLQLQLLLYLDASMGLSDQAKPAGAFYFHVAEPLVKTDEDVREVAQALMSKALMLRGVTLSDVTVLRAMDGGDVSTVLPLKTNKQGELDSSLPALNDKQMAQFLQHAKQVATQLSEKMLSGDVAIDPYQLGSETACDRCDYAAVCGFDASSEEIARQLNPMSQETLREFLNQGAKP